MLISERTVGHTTAPVVVNPLGAGLLNVVGTRFLATADIIGKFSVTFCPGVTELYCNSVLGLTYN